MPDIPIVDAHLHLWNPALLSYPWLAEVPRLNKPYLMDDYNHQTRGTAIEQMVFVQCECTPEQCEQEVAWVTEIAGHDRRITGMVPWAPLELGEKATNVLDRYASNKLIKGIRRIIQFEADPDFCLRPDFINGVKLLAGYNWSFDICIAHHQLPKVIALVDECPNVSFMLDHCAKPDIRARDIRHWDNNIRELSLRANVHCKLSGLVTEADHSNWTVDELKPYAEAVLNYFGPDRLVFGGDWPVVCQASAYNRWINTTDTLLAQLNADERYLIYNQNARLFYQLNTH